MKHPQREEWVPYLFGEADPQTKKNLAAHLNACPDCARELSIWRKSLHRLDAWKLPHQRQRRIPAFSPALNLAAAALLVLGIGFGAGRWFGSFTGQAHSPAGLESSLKAALLPELRQNLREEWAAELQSRLDQIGQDSLAALERVKVETTANTAQALQQVVTALAAERGEDQEVFADWVDSLRKQHDTDFVSLRKDLETVAAATDEQIRAARLKLLELTSVNLDNH